MSTAREVLYGGAASGGKTEGLLMGAAQYVDHPGYSALLLRRTLEEQKPAGSFVEKSKKLGWREMGAEWRQADMTWRFPSGAIIQFAYLDTLEDAHRYRTAEFQYIGFDELTTLADEDAYTFMFSRLRRLAGVEIPVRMRAGTNPGGAGMGWVKRRWNLQGKPKEPVYHDGRVFIPATMYDNPIMDAADYEESLNLVRDPITRAQIKDGDWEAYVGGRFKPSWLRYYQIKGGVVWMGLKNYLLSQLYDRFLTVDPAATVQKNDRHDPDWTSSSAWALTPCGNLLWLDNKRARVEIPDIDPLVAEQYVEWAAQRAYVEGFGIGKGPVQNLQRYILPSGRHMNVIPYTPGGKKLLERAAEALSLAEAGRLWLPGEGGRVDPVFEEPYAELVRFTGDEKADGHDDTVENLAKAAAVVSGKVPSGHSTAPTSGSRPHSMGTFGGGLVESRFGWKGR